MAGSYNHVTTDGGRLRSNQSFVGMIENLGDAYEAVEEMFGMIWWLASYKADHPDLTGSPAELVEHARVNYKTGLLLAQHDAEPKKRSGEVG